MPAGSSRGYWVKRLGLQDLPNLERDFQLLKYGTIAPIGNLRIKESVPEKAKRSLPVTFSIADVSELQIDFIEHALIMVSRRGAMVSYGMESGYAILGEPTAKPLLHADVIRRLLVAFNKKENYGNTRTLLDVEAELEGKSGIAAFVVEWVRRDLFNIAFGNSDNHGRSTFFIKYGNRVQLAPIYDFAPMKADYEMITRTFTWGEGIELGGVYNFPAIAEHLSDLRSLNELMSALNETAVRLLGLEQRLRQRGVPELILAHSGIGFATLEARMQQWAIMTVSSNVAMDSIETKGRGGRKKILVNRKPLTFKDREDLLLAATLDLFSGKKIQGQVLKWLRVELLLLSQDQYAKMVGVSRKALSDIESDKGKNGVELINRVSAFLVTWVCKHFI